MSLLEAASNPYHITGASHHHDSTLPLCRSQNELGVTSARVHVRVNRVVVVCCCTFFASSIALHSEWGQMTNATAIKAVPVLEDVYAGTTQKWSLRLNVPQHGKTHQVLTHSKH